MRIVIGVYVGSESGALELFALDCTAGYLLLELLDVGSIALSELGEGLLGHTAIR